MKFVYRIPLHNRKLANSLGPINDDIMNFIPLVGYDKLREIIRMTKEKSTDVMEIQITPNVTIRNITAFYHFDDVKVVMDCAELVVKDDNLSLLRHFFNKVLRVPNSFFFGNIIEIE